jgi:hypothetical protein
VSESLVAEINDRQPIFAVAQLWSVPFVEVMKRRKFRDFKSVGFCYSSDPNFDFHFGMYCMKCITRTRNLRPNMILAKLKYLGTVTELSIHTMRKIYAIACCGDHCYASLAVRGKLECKFVEFVF